MFTKISIEYFFINTGVTVMSTYVMADLHGRFTELQEMLKKIDFGLEDKLIIAGDL